MKLKIVHFVIDDKFIDGAISLFEADDRVENTYVIIGQENDCQHIKYKGIQFVDYEDALDFINTFNVVIFHSLPAIPINIVKDIKNDVKVVWFAWGYDIYEDPYDVISIRLLGKVTKRNTRLLRIRKYFDWRYWRSKYIVLKHLRKVLERIDYFSGVFPYEIY